jgi:hypothetical protein
MSKHFTREIVAEQAIILAEPRHQVVVDRSFEMPKALYGATVALYLGFIAVLGIGLQSPGLAIPMAIFAIFIVAGFGVPTIWTRLAPQSGQRPLELGQLMRQGIATNTGRLRGRDAVVQMMILPVLIVAWGIAIVAIVATV